LKTPGIATPMQTVPNPEDEINNEDQSQIQQNKRLKSSHNPEEIQLNLDDDE